MTAPQPGTPGSENHPAGDGPPSVADRSKPGAPPPGSNQRRDEGTPPAPDAMGDSGTVGSADPQRGGALNIPGEAHVQRDSGGAAPPGAMADDDATGAARTAPGAPPASQQQQPAPSPGEAPGVSVPSVQSASGTSEDSDAVTGIRATAIVRPGKPDGEVDTRR